MEPIDKKELSERDICTKYITPAIVEKAGWDLHTQIREEFYFTKGCVYVKGKSAFAKRVLCTHVSLAWCM